MVLSYLQVTSQAAELATLQLAHADLQSRLNMAEVLTQQLSAESPQRLHDQNSSDRFDELRREVCRLEAEVRGVREERDQALSDLDGLRAAMSQQRQDTASQVGCVCRRREERRS